jgi:ABC-type glutathione transport system ATPase component
VLCILGESGSGKSVTLRALMRLLPPRSTRIEGEVRIDGQDVLAMRPQALRDLRGGLAAMIFQEPMTALDPVYTVGQQIGEAVRRHTGCGSHASALWSCWNWCESHHALCGLRALQLEDNPIAAIPPPLRLLPARPWRRRI